MTISDMTPKTKPYSLGLTRTHRSIPDNIKIQIVKILNNSTNGNPKFLVELCDSEQYETLETKSDYSYCYNIENLSNKKCDCQVTYYYTPKGNGKIEDIKEIKKCIFFPNPKKYILDFNNSI